MKNLKLFLIGIIIGFGKIIPGVSGAMFAMIFGVYEKSLYIISHFNTEFNRNKKFIILLGFGITLSVFCGSNIIKFFLNKYYLCTMMLFIGMMTAGIIPLFKEIREEKFNMFNFILSIIIVLFFIIISSIKIDNSSELLLKNPISFILIIITGFLDALGTVVPGICGTALLMIIGYYDLILNSLSSVFNISKIADNLFVLIPFVIGMVFGIFFIARIVNYLFKKFKIKTYYCIIGFALSSILLLFLSLFKYKYSAFEIFMSIILFIIGYIISYIFDKIK